MVVRQAHHERRKETTSGEGKQLDFAHALVSVAGQPRQPSFRRKPESRILGSRLVLFPENFLDSGFRRNDGLMMRLPRSVPAGICRIEAYIVYWGRNKSVREDKPDADSLDCH